MNLTRLSLANPAALVVVVLLLVGVGTAALFKLPIQLLPPIDQPQISVSTFWRGAAPADMESVIIEQQERVLRNLPGLTQIQSNINQSRGNINLTFEMDHDMQRAYLDVINRLQQVPALPREANGPWVNLAGGNFSSGNAASLLVRAVDADDPRSPGDFHPVVDRYVEPALARIPGVAEVNLQSHRPEEVRIVLNAPRAAALGVQLSDITRAVSTAADVSGGFADVGRRQYTVRFMGKAPMDRLDELIVAYRGTQPIYLGDLATVSLQRVEQGGFTLRNGFPAYYITVAREAGSNTVEILDHINAVIEELNAGPLPEAGLALELSYDASVHIRRAIRLVQGNLLLGGLLATLVLFAFLRDLRSTLLVGLTIPVCLFAAFATLDLFNRSLNVISLAALAFAVGLVVDAAIIAQENIVRLRQSGLAVGEAVLRGATEVAPALFASTATSIAIFLPILFMSGPEGQLFSDLALTLSIAVVVSLVAALTVLPTASAHWLGRVPTADRMGGLWDRVTRGVLALTDRPSLRLLWILGLTVGAGALAWSLVPKADYLPRARSDNAWVNFSVPAGASQAALREDLGKTVVQRLAPHMTGEKQPQVAYYNLSSWGRWSGMAIYPADPKQADALMEVLRSDITVDLPDISSFVTMGSLLNFSGGGNRRIDVDIHGADLTQLLAAARAGMAAFGEAMPDVPVQPRPSLSLAEPELRVVPDDTRIAQTGLTRGDVGQAVRAYTDGLYVGEYFDGNNRHNVVIRADSWDTPEGLAELPLYTPQGGIQMLGELAWLERHVGPSELRRIDGQRTVTLRVFPPETVTLEEAIETIRAQVEPAITAQLGAEGSVRYRGSADGLEEALASMGRNLLYALLILLLILAAMYRSLWSAIIVLSVMPLAFAGGVTALTAMNLFTFQSMDLLTMSGFIILLGLVVNNAILLVDRTQRAEAEGLDRRDAVASAVRQRARPIYMSTLTSIFGMLPLMLMPGTGAEIYRGLAAIIVGGMLASALFTLLLLPSLLRLRFRRSKASAPEAGAAHGADTAQSGA